MINAIFIDGPKHSTSQEIHHAFQELHFARLPEVLLPRGMFDTQHQRKMTKIFAKLGVDLPTPTVEVEHHAYRLLVQTGDKAIYRYMEPCDE